MNVLHKDILIQYDEAGNEWTFTLRNRARTAPSLKQAREAIDRPVATAKSKAFEPVDGWLVDYSGHSVPGRVTSLLTTRYGQERVNFVETNEARTSHQAARGEQFTNFFPNTPANATLIIELKRIAAEAHILRVQREATRAQLKTLDTSVIPE